MNKNTTLLTNCNYCPRNCNVNRNESAKGYCKTDSEFYIASIFVHKGEEPPISGEKGICNVFYAHCNLQCVYCQNHQISNNNTPVDEYKMPFDIVIKKITNILDKGINMLGFVSPSHFVPQTIQIIEKLHKLKYFPTIVYNTNAYEKVETLKLLENYVDVYLPDLKYSNQKLADKYSFAKNYPQIAYNAVAEMFRQKGEILFVNNKGYAESGLIIRHLILPNHVQNSIDILRYIAAKISTKVNISIMSQYFPTSDAFKYPELSRPITEKEYKVIVNEAEKLGLKNGWIQELISKDNYQPDFNNQNPFNDF